MPNWKKLIVSGSDANLNSLDITANNTVGGLLKVADGTNSAPSITFTDDTDTGIYRSADNSFNITVGGVNKFVVNSSGITSGGNVYSGNSSQFRNYGGVWQATTGVSGNGFKFSSADLADLLTISSTGNAVFKGNIKITDTSGTRGVFRDNTAYDLRLGGGTVYTDGAYISLSGGTRGGGTSSSKGRVEIFSGGSNFSSQGDITGDILIGAQWNGGTSNIIVLDSSTNNATFAGNATFNGDIDADDITIDTWGSVSASLATLTDNQIDGSGTADYVARFSDADTLTTGVIRDDGSTVGINAAPSAVRTLYIDGTIQATGEAFFKNFDIIGTNSSTSRFRDDVLLRFGTDRIFGLKYNSTADQLQFVSSSLPLITLSGDGDVVIPSGSLSISGDGANAVTLTESGNGDFTIDAPDDIRLDAGGADIVLRYGGTEYGRLSGNNQHLKIRNITQDKDIIFEGNDGGTTIEALKLDMSAKGKATFSGNGIFSEQLTINAPDDGGSPANTSILHIKGYEGRGAGIRIQDSKNSATDPSNREWFIGSGYGQSGFNIGYAADGSQSSYAAQNFLKITTSGAATFTGDVTVEGALTAQEFHTEFVSASIIYQSGSTKFGDTVDDNHDFTGSLEVLAQSGASGLTIKRSATAFVNINNSSTRNEFNFDSTSGLRFYHGTDSTSPLFISSSGEVGVMTVDPHGYLQLGQYSGVATDGGQSVFGGGLNIFTNSGVAGLFLGVKNAAYANRGYSFKNTTVGVNSKFEIIEHGSSGTRFTINSGGKVQLNTYGSGTHTGTLAKSLGVDSSGNVIEFTGGSGGGTVSSITSGADNRVAIFNGSDSLEGDADLVFDGSKLGIGLSSPTHHLTVIGNTTNVVAKFQSTDNQAWISVHDDDSGTYGALFGTDTDAGHDIVLANHSATKRLVIDTSGNVGIGTDSPGGKLDVHGDLHVGSGGNKARLKSDGTHTYLDAIPSNSDIVFRNAGSVEKMRLNSGGNLGIGTTSPAGKLHINTGTGTGNANTVIIDRPASSDYSGVSFATAGTVDWSIGHNSANNLEIFEDGLNSKTRVTVETGGNVGIGTDNPIYKLHIAGSTYVNSGTLFIDSGNRLTWGNSQQSIRAVNSSTMTFQTGNSDRMFLTATGDLQVTGKVLDADIKVPNQNLLDIGSIKIPNRDDIYSNATKTTVDEFKATYANDGTGASTIRLYVDDGVLVDGDNYTVSVYYEGLVGTLNMDWTDVALTGNHTSATGTTSSPASGRIYGYASRSDYDSTFRFLDINLTSGASNTVTLFHPKVEVGTVVTDFVGTERTNQEGNSKDLNNLNVTGKVGIGTTAPNDALQIKGDGKGFYISSTDYNVARIIPRGTGGNLDKGLLSLLDAGVEDIRIDAGGHSWINTGYNLGIGTTTPAYTLDVNGDIQNNGVLRRGGNVFIKSTGSETKISPAGSGAISFHNSATMNSGDETMRIDANGNLVINNTSGNARLDVRQDTGQIIRAENASGQVFAVSSSGDVDISGDLVVAGALTAQEFHTEFVSASIIYDSGSTKFGDTLDDNHDFTGSVNVSGSVHLTDNSTLKLGNVSGGDLQLYHNGSHSLVSNQTGNLYIRNQTNDGKVYFQADDGNGNDTNYFYLDGGQSDGTNFATRFPDQSIILLGSGTSWNDGSQLYHNGSNFYLNEYVGNMNFTVHTNDGDIIFNSDDGSGGVSQYYRIDGGASLNVFSKDIFLADNKKALFGSNSDLKIYHDGTDSIIQNYVGSIYIDSNADDQDIVFRCDDGSGGLTDYLRLDGSARSIVVSAALGMYFNDGVAGRFGNDGDMHLYHDGTNSVINNTTGHLQIYNNADDGDIQFISDDGSGGTAEYFRVDGGDTTTVVSKPFRFQDNVKAKFGAGSDLQIYHDSSNSYIETSAASAGDLYIKAQGTNHDLYLQSTDDIFIRPQGGEMGIKVQGNDNVELYFNNVRKFRTTNTGGIIEGDLDADDITIDDWGSVSASLSAIQTAGGVNGTGASNRVALWSDSDTLTSDSGLTFANSTLNVASTTNDYVAKFSHTTATGYAPGSILLQAGQSTSRGQGLFHYNTEADESWFTGVPYNVTSKKWIVANKSDTTFNPDVAQLSHALLTIDSDTGNTGVGISSPVAKFHVYQNDTEVDTAAGITIEQDGTGDAALSFLLTGIKRWRLGIDNSDSDKFKISTSTNLASENRVTIDTDGNVGIGTTDPTFNLHVNSASNGVTAIGVGNTGTGASRVYLDASNGDFAGSDYMWIGQNNDLSGEIFMPQSAGSFHIKTQPGGTATTQFTVNQAGNVGIGTTSPKQIFHVSGGSTAGDVTKAVIGATGGNAESHLYLAENFNGDNVNWGFSFVADGNSSNNLLIKRHSNNTSGVTVLTINRDNNNASFSGELQVASNLDINGTSLTLSSAAITYQNNNDVDTGTETIATVVKANHDAAFFDYVVKNGTNLRAGTVMAVHDGTNVEFTDNSTKDIGDTSGVTFSVDISGTDLRLRATTTSDNWIIKSLVRAL